MSPAMPFNLPQMSCVNKAFSDAEDMVSCFFRLNHGDMKANRYDVKTMKDLLHHEVDKGAFAHLCKYYYQKSSDAGDPGNFHFYRVCLQDDRILDAVDRAKSFIKLSALMLYIATHELVHVVRFNRGDSDFDAPVEAKVMEEEKVNSITRAILQPDAETGMALVMDCFSKQYRIDKVLV
jgi:hypothetical protein